MRIVTGEPPAATRLRAHSLMRCCVAKRIGDVRLQGDAGAGLLEAGAVERAHEDFGREVLVAVLLHVEVDELGHGRAVARV